MVNFIFGVQIISGILLIILVLLHSPKGDGIASIGSISQIFTSQKSAEDGLNKVTYIVGGIFILTTLLLGYGLIR
ncbi:preprotein translocase subunit SecG [bacterium]|nr:preprotein translocase subunit SecG [bacterium]